MRTVSAELARDVEAATTARARVRRSVGDVARALADAAERWRRAPGLIRRLADESGIAPAMLDDALDDVVAPFDAAAMERLATAERSGAPAPPPVVAHVLASNVPALALPAIAHALLAGAAVVVKSGRADGVSAPLFRDALATVDPALAATIVATGWPRGDVEADATLLAAAPVVVLTGSDEALATLAPRATGRVLTFGDRTSVAVLDDVSPAAADALARDVACWEQRGCLSPHVVFSAGDLDAVAAAVAAALERRAARWPSPADLDVRAARRSVVAEAEWAGRRVHAGAWGAVLVEPAGPVGDGPGGRTVRLQPLGDVATLSRRLQTGTIECVGTTGPIPPDLDALGVSRVCGLGAMQRPSLAWARGRRPPIRMLLDPDATAPMTSEAP